MQELAGGKAARRLVVMKGDIRSAEDLNRAFHAAAEPVGPEMVPSAGTVEAVLHFAAVKTLAEASSLLDAFCQQPGVSLALEERAGWEVFHQLLRNGGLPPRLSPMPICRPWRSPMAGAW